MENRPARPGPLDKPALPDAAAGKNAAADHPADVRGDAFDLLGLTRVVDEVQEGATGERTHLPGDTQIQLPEKKQDFSGDYELLNKLGEGAMGEVYRARQISFDRQVALKVMFP